VRHRLWPRPHRLGPGAGRDHLYSVLSDQPWCDQVVGYQRCTMTPTPGSHGTSGYPSTGCGSPLPMEVGSQLSLWTSPSTGNAKPTLPTSQMTRLGADGDCRTCGGEQSFYVQPMSGWLVEWCGRCRVETLVERRRMPRE
jgi:hypothetical protein